MKENSEHDPHLHMTEDLQVYAAYLRHERRALKVKLEGIKTKLKEAESANRRRGHWVDVGQVKLKVDRAYYVRRVHADGPPARPALARWTKSGWKVIGGDILQGLGRGPSIEVWVSK